MNENSEGSTGISHEKDYHDRYFKEESVLNSNMLSAAYDRVFRFLLKYGIPSTQAKILSLGCSKGKIEIKASYLVGQILGVDISDVAIQEARVRSANLANINFLCEDTKKLIFPPNSFDSIWALGLLHHLDDASAKKLVSNCKEWLRPGGYFYPLIPALFGLSIYSNRYF